MSNKRMSKKLFQRIVQVKRKVRVRMKMRWKINSNEITWTCNNFIKKISF